jgi:acyl carrier protein
MAVKPEDIVALFLEFAPDLRIGEGDLQRPLADLGVDSLDKANVLLEVQERLGVVVPDEDMDSLDSVSAIADYINSRSGNTG